MADLLMLKHNDACAAPLGYDWETYIRNLHASHNFLAGSAIGAGVRARKSGPIPSITEYLTGSIFIQADSLEHAQQLLAGNPVYESGGTAALRELPITD